MNLRSGASTAIGQVRAANEDDLIACSPIFAVADGMGGHAAGEVASALTVASLQELADCKKIGTDAVLAAITEANASILAEAERKSARTGMGTTVSGIAVVSVGDVEHWAVFNVGDSRVYRYAAGALAQVTVDHSEVEELVAAGSLSAAEAREHPHRNVITRSLGSDPPPAVDVWVFPPTVGERFLVCSDGLTTELADDEIAAVLAAVVDPKSAADELVDRAVAAGGHDNVTVVVVDVLTNPALSIEVDTAPRSRLGQVGQ